MAHISNKIPLNERAVHPFMLLFLQTQVINGKPLGEYTSTELITLFVQPNTEAANSDYMNATAQKYARHPWNRELKFKDDMPASVHSLGVERLAKDKPLCGPATYFLSHCWAYKFKDLVSLVIRHYDAQPITEGGTVYAPMYYWVDLFAVHQNFKGDFKDHPDSDFPAVIRACQAVLFTIMPWRAPLCVERVWCLYEALQAVTSHTELQLLVEPIESPQTMDKLQTTFTNVVVNSLDIRKCKASVAADRVYILKQIESTLGVDKFNTIMQDALRRKVMEVMLMTAVQRNDLDSSTKLVKSGVRITQPVVSFAGYMAFNTDDKGLKALGELLKISAAGSVVLHTTAPSKATAEGYQALMSALKHNATLTDLTLAKPPGEDLSKHTGGWVGPKAAFAIAEWLQTNTTLKRLSLSRQIKLGGAGLTQLARGLAGAENSALQELHIPECGGDPKAMAAVADALATGAQPSLSAAVGGGGWGTSGRLGHGGGSGSFFAGLTGIAQGSGASFTSVGRSNMSFSSGVAGLRGMGGGPLSGGPLSGGPLSGGQLSAASFTGKAGALPTALTPNEPFGRSGLLSCPRMPIQRVDLSLNNIGDGEGAVAVGKFLKATHTLRVLELRYCEMGSAGIKALSDGLGMADSITKLDISGNKMGDDGAMSLAMALKRNRTLAVLVASKCDIKVMGARELGAVLKAPQCALQDVTLCHNVLSPAGWVHLGTGLRGNSSLARLDLAYTGCTSKEGVAGLAAGLGAHKGLQEVDLRGNRMAAGEAEGAAMVLMDSLKSNTVLCKLYLQGCLTEVAATRLAPLMDAAKQLEVDLRTPKDTSH